MSENDPPAPPALAGRPSRLAIVKRAVWGLVRAGAGRAPEGAYNYGDDGPRFARAETEMPPGLAATSNAAAERDDRLRVVSFNIDHGLEHERAAALFAREERMQGVHVVLLQEMEETGCAALAAALGMAYVYYPAGRHPLSGRHFGNAVLARGRLVRDARHLLPHVGRVRGTRRVAVAATAEVGGRVVTAISVHLATLLDASLAAQRDQIVAVLEWAQDFPEPVIIGGDFNRRALGHVVERRGYRWVTRRAGASFGPFAIDHLFVRGVGEGVTSVGGVVRDTGGASDHRPVWMELDFRA